MCHRDPVEVKKLRIEIGRLQNEIHQRDVEIVHLHNAKISLQGELTLLETQISDLKRDLEEENDASFKELKADLDNANSEIAYQRKLINRLLQYEHSQAGLVSELLYHDTLDGRKILKDAGRLPA